MRLTIAQMKMSMDMESNLKNALSHIETASFNSSEMVLFPELMLTPFFPQYPLPMLKGLGIEKAAFSNEESDDAVQRIRDKAREIVMYLCPNFYIRDSSSGVEKFFDRSYLIDPHGDIAGYADMVNISTSEFFNENDYYFPSEKGYQVFDTRFGRVGIVICFDRHIAESIRSCALQGASLVLIPAANTEAEPLEMFEWEMRVAAYQNNVFIAMANRTGAEDQMKFAGRSLVISPEGEIIASADDSDMNLDCELDLSEAKRSRAGRSYISFVYPDNRVYHIDEGGASSNDSLLQKLYDEVSEYDKGDPMRIQHFTKVWTYSRLIGHGEGLSSVEEMTLEAAAILHDIGIHKAEKDFGSSADPLQEKLGPGEAYPILMKLDFPEKMTERILYLIGHHHTYKDIDGADYQILVEADFLVNIYEDGLNHEAAMSAYNNIFKTETGKKMFRSMYGE